MFNYILYCIAYNDYIYVSYCYPEYFLNMISDNKGYSETLNSQRDVLIVYTLINIYEMM